MHLGGGWYVYTHMHTICVFLCVFVFVSILVFFNYFKHFFYPYLHKKLSGKENACLKLLTFILHIVLTTGETNTFY